MWDYNASVGSPIVRTFTLPNPSKVDGLLPFGALVENGSGSELGLVVVAPSSGLVTYWESIEDADALSLFAQKRNGVEGNIGSMLSGETVEGIEDVKGAGFILLMSSGRIAHLTLRDAQSKPAVSINFLKSHSNHSRGIGLFGSIRTALGGSGWLKDVVAVRSRQAQTRGQSDAVVASKGAVFQFWQLGWSGQAYMQKEVDAKSALDTAIKTMLEPETGYHTQEVNLLDFAITPASETALVSLPFGEQPETVNIVALVSISGESTPIFALAEIEFVNSIVSVRRVLHLNSYTPSLSDVSSTSKASLSVPQPFHTAFVTFEKAVTIVSLDKLALSPDAQLAADTHKLPEPFQDSVYLRDDKDVTITSIAAEHSMDSSHSSVIVSISGFGLVRVAAYEPSNDLQAIERFRISAKSRIEQAVFFGSLPSNPLNLAKKPLTAYNTNEVEAAALVISREVIGTSSQFVPDTASSMQQHLQQRADALHTLASHLRNSYPQISRLTKWQLRWDAEKLAAAQETWRLYDKQDQGRKRLIANLVELIHERFKTEPSVEKGELDAVRHWFLKDVYRIDVLIAWGHHGVSELFRDGDIKDSMTLVNLISDADDLVLGSMETAFKFRTENAWLYQLDGEDVEDDLLNAGYADLPEPWTSEYNLIEKTRLLADAVRGLAAQFVLDSAKFGPVDSTKVMKITEENLRLVAITCKGFEERIRWCLAQPDAKTQANGNHLRQLYEDARSRMLIGFAEIGMANEGMELAEKYADMRALVHLVHWQSASLFTQLTKEGETVDAKKGIAELERCVKRYFDKFGKVWADRFYTDKVYNERYTDLLSQAKLHQPELTTFLRETPSRMKLSWINDVLGERDYDTASRTLSNIAITQETILWSKKVQLSLSKLAGLASRLTIGEASGEVQIQEAKQRPSELELVRIQEKLYDHIRPSFYDAVDRAAELQLAMEKYGKRNTKGKSTFYNLLERGLESLVNQVAMSPEQLIDVLTLMDQDSSGSNFGNIFGQEIFLAFKTLKNSGIPQTDDRYNFLLKTIWRRCFIRDPWERINDTASKSDQGVVQELQWTTAFETFCLGDTACRFTVALMNWQLTNLSTALWDGPLGVPQLGPSEVLGTGTSVEEWSLRFPSADICEPMAKDAKYEDRMLQRFMEQHRLEQWVLQVKEYARQRQKTRIEEKAEHEQQMQDVKERTSRKGAGEEKESQQALN